MKEDFDEIKFKALLDQVIAQPFRDLGAIVKEAQALTNNAPVAKMNDEENVQVYVACVHLQRALRSAEEFLRGGASVARLAEVDGHREKVLQACAYLWQVVPARFDQKRRDRLRKLIEASPDANRHDASTLASAASLDVAHAEIRKELDASAQSGKTDIPSWGDLLEGLLDLAGPVAKHFYLGTDSAASEVARIAPQDTVSHEMGRRSIERHIQKLLDGANPEDRDDIHHFGELMLDIHERNHAAHLPAPTRTIDDELEELFALHESRERIREKLQGRCDERVRAAKARGATVTEQTVIRARCQKEIEQLIENFYRAKAES